jgi:hypothetical protein
MTLPPKEKAMELVASYWAIHYERDKTALLQWMQGREKYGVPFVAKEGALLCVQEILEIIPKPASNSPSNITYQYYHYWQEVKAHLSRM